MKTKISHKNAQVSQVGRSLRLSRMLLYALPLVALLAGCAVVSPAVERRTVREMAAKGWQPAANNAEVLEFTQISKDDLAKAGVAPTITRMTVSQAAWDAHPYLYAASQTIDNVLIPGGLSLGTAYLASKAKIGGGGGDTTINNYGDGDVNNNTGNGNTGNGNGQDKKPNTNTNTGLATAHH